MAMIYFDLFQIPVQLKLNPASLSKKFFELSKKYHPDYFATENEAAQAEALEKSALLNKAWKTFQNSDATIKYVLLEKGLLTEEEKYELPPDFLMEMDEKSDTGALSTNIAQLSSEIYEPVKEIVEHYQEGITTEKELLQVKEYYYKKKYIDRINRELSAQK
jgi:molecular chaperone HscB